MNQQLINELREIEAMAQVLGEKAAKMRQKLEKDSKPVSKKEQTAKQFAAMINAKREAQFKPNL